MIELRNPHSVLAVLDVRPQDVLEVRLRAIEPHGAWEQVVDRAARIGVAVQRGVEPLAGRRRPKHDPSPADGGRTGSAVAVVRPRDDVPLETLFARPEPVAATDAATAPAGHGLWFALDCIQDPHNVGAIFRSAAFFGVQGIVLTKDRSAPLAGTVYDVASGGIEHVPFSVQTNLARALDAAKTLGLWTLGTSEHATDELADVPRDRPWLVILGNEESGLRRLTRDKCDSVCRVAAHGPVGSLNVSVAAGVLMHALTRDA